MGIISQSLVNNKSFLLETVRLCLRPIREFALEPLFAYRNDPKVAGYQGWDLPYPREKAQQWILNPELVVPTLSGGLFQLPLNLSLPGI